LEASKFSRGNQRYKDMGSGGQDHLGARDDLWGHEVP
jgi:hypothetical protein